LGQLAETTDGLGTADAVTTAYTYTIRGDIDTVSVDGTEVADAEYDTAGNRDVFEESNSGTSKFEYYSNHLIETATDAKGNETYFRFDGLGRLFERHDGNGTVDEVINTWDWDSAINGKGRLASRSNGSQFTETYTYDGSGRLDTLSADINVSGFNDNSNYVIDYDYDGSGRLSSIDYPNLTVTNVYTARGYLSQVKKGSAILHEYTDVDAFGNVVGEEFDNGLQTARSYDPETGELLSIQTGTSSLPKSLQDLVYEWQTDGALLKRIDKQGTTSTGDDLTELFGYDGIGRLESAGVAATGRDLTFTYDDHGNLLSKLSDVSGDLDVTSYNYPTSTKPHRLASVTIGGVSNTLSYDSAGNITQYNAASGDDTFIDYDRSSRVTKITVGASAGTGTPTARDEFWYGPDGQRFLRKATWDDSGTQKTSWTLYLLGGVFEEVHPEHDSGISYRQRVLVTDTVSHRYVKSPTSSWSNIDYFHRDHLGSITAKTTDAGVVHAEVDFDPFGRQREATWDSDVTATLLNTLAAQEDSFTGRGFTDHEMLNRTGFVHMNGRVYDSRIGRFIQPDPIVGDPTSGENYNRYAYVLNSPLSFTDPSGLDRNALGGAPSWMGNSNDGPFPITIRFGIGIPTFVWGTLDKPNGQRYFGGHAPGESIGARLPQILGSIWDFYNCVRHGLCAGGSAPSIPGVPQVGGFGTGACGELGGGNYCISFDSNDSVEPNAQEKFQTAIVLLADLIINARSTTTADPMTAQAPNVPSDDPRVTQDGSIVTGVKFTLPTMGPVIDDIFETTVVTRPIQRIVEYEAEIISAALGGPPVLKGGLRAYKSYNNFLRSHGLTSPKARIARTMARILNATPATNPPKVPALPPPSPPVIVRPLN